MRKVLLGILLAAVAFSACDDIEVPFNEFDELGKGAIPRTVSPPTGSFNYFNPSGSNVTFTVEFYDENKGKNVQSFSWEASYSQDFPREIKVTPGSTTIDSTPVVVGMDTTYTYDTTVVRPDTVVTKGAYSRRYGPVQVASQTSDQWTLNEQGLPQATYTFNFSEILAALNVPLDSIDGGQQIRFRGTLTKKDGQVFTFDNTDANLRGQPTFNALFGFNQAIVCPSDLAGSYTAVSSGTSTDGCCPGTTNATAQVTLTALGGGRYTINDWSGGLYLAWYGPDGGDYGITQELIDTKGQLSTPVVDACGTFRIPSFVEPFGESTTGIGTVTDNTITYTFLNGYGDAGTVTLTKN